MGKYIACLIDCEKESIRRSAQQLAEQTAQFLQENPEIAVGTVVVIAGVTVIATLGVGGSIILVPALLLL